MPQFVPDTSKWDQVVPPYAVTSLVLENDLRVVQENEQPWDFSRFAPGYLELLA